MGHRQLSYLSMPDQCDVPVREFVTEFSLAGRYEPPNRFQASSLTSLYITMSQGLRVLKEKASHSGISLFVQFT